MADYDVHGAYASLVPGAEEEGRMRTAGSNMAAPGTFLEENYDDEYDDSKYRMNSAPFLQSKGSQPLKPSIGRKSDSHILYGTTAKIHPYSIVINQKPEAMAEDILRLREELNRMIKRSVSD